MSCLSFSVLVGWRFWPQLDTQSIPGPVPEALYTVTLPHELECSVRELSKFWILMISVDL